MDNAPKLGQQVIFRDQNGFERAAFIAKIWSNETVNLTVLQETGDTMAVGNVIYSESPQAVYCWYYPAA